MSGYQKRKFRVTVPETCDFSNIVHTMTNIESWLQAGRKRIGSSSPGIVRNFLFSTSSIQVLRSTQFFIQWAPKAISLGVKRPDREADHSSPTSAEVKKI
jgi:hypothetical protein